MCVAFDSCVSRNSLVSVHVQRVCGGITEVEEEVEEEVVGEEGGQRRG